MLDKQKEKFQAHHNHHIILGGQEASMLNATTFVVKANAIMQHSAVVFCR